MSVKFVLAMLLFEHLSDFSYDKWVHFIIAIIDFLLPLLSFYSSIDLTQSDVINWAGIQDSATLTCQWMVKLTTALRDLPSSSALFNDKDFKSCPRYLT